MPCPQKRTRAAPVCQAASCSGEQHGAAEEKCLGTRGRQDLGRAFLLSGLAPRNFVLEGDRRVEFLSTSSGASLVKENLHPSIKYLSDFSLKL